MRYLTNMSNPSQTKTNVNLKKKEQIVSQNVDERKTVALSMFSFLMLIMLTSLWPEQRWVYRQLVSVSLSRNRSRKLQLQRKMRYFFFFHFIFRKTVPIKNDCSRGDKRMGKVSLSGGEGWGVLIAFEESPARCSGAN